MSAEKEGMTVSDQQQPTNSSRYPFGWMPGGTVADDLADASAVIGAWHLFRDAGAKDRAVLVVADKVARFLSNLLVAAVADDECALMFADDQRSGDTAARFHDGGVLVEQVLSSTERSADVLRKLLSGDSAHLKQKPVDEDFSHSFSPLVGAPDGAGVGASQPTEGEPHSAVCDEDDDDDYDPAQPPWLRKEWARWFGEAQLPLPRRPLLDAFDSVREILKGAREVNHLSLELAGGAGGLVELDLRYRGDHSAGQVGDGSGLGESPSGLGDVAHDSSPWVGAPDGAGVGASQPTEVDHSRGERDRRTLRDEVDEVLASVPPVFVCAKVSRRDGDQCRSCGTVVDFFDDRTPFGGVYHDIGQGLDAVAAIAVFCRGCQRNAESGSAVVLTPPPARPVYSDQTRKWLDFHSDCGPKPEEV